MRLCTINAVDLKVKESGCFYESGNFYSSVNRVLELVLLSTTHKPPLMKSKFKMNSPVYSDKIFLKIIFQARIDLAFYSYTVTRKCIVAIFFLKNSSVQSREKMSIRAKYIASGKRP